MQKFFSKILLLLFMMYAMQLSALSILLVNDNNRDSERIEVIKTAITNSGYDYTLYDTDIEGSSPTYLIMSSFDLVIWYTGNDGVDLYFWNGNDTDNEAIIQYINEGGMFWVQGLDFLYDRYDPTPVSFAEGDFVYDYLGISEYFAQSHVDDGVFSDGVSQLNLISGNPIFTLNPIKWTYETMYYVDACIPTSMARKLYRMGPSGYDFYNYYSGIYLEKGDGKVVSFTFETARLDTPQNTDELFSQGLDYFAQFSGDVVHVSSINTYGDGNASTISENGGSLQIYADVLPENATNKTVFWSVHGGTATATISEEGLLSASGSNIGNGTVWVIAETADGSGVTDSVEITISNQGGGPNSFEILLVNDNSYGSDRYLVIDTTIHNLGYIYDIYNTVVTGERPDYNTLSNYDLVIWYTGNDGANLFLWDTTNSLNYRFNNDLINYIDNGGNVWLQGLDFMYDILGTPPNEFSSGQFIYDYMGITKYVAQSYVNDGGQGLPQLDVRNNNGICSYTPINWVYSTLWYADAFDVKSGVRKIYKMGPSGYILSGYVNSFMNKPSDGIIMTWAFETARIDTREHTETIFDEVIQYFMNLTGINEDTYANTNLIVYPNPTSSDFHFKYKLIDNSNVVLKIFDISGNEIVVKNMGIQNAGEHVFSSSKEKLNLPAGVYFYKLVFNGNSSSGKLIFN